MSNIAFDIYLKCHNSILSMDGSLRADQVIFKRYEEHLMIASPMLFDEISTALVKLVPARTEIIAGVGAAQIPIAQMIASKCGLPLVMMRRSDTNGGIVDCPLEFSLSGKRVLIVDDLYGDGERLLSAAQYLRVQGAVIEKSLALLDDQNGAAFRLFNHDIDSIALFCQLDGDELLRLNGDPVNAPLMQKMERYWLD
jgi:orotate phosphoribosyltransferase